MRLVDLVMPLEPVPKGRPRFSAHYNYINAHTPPRTKRFEQDVALFYIQSNSPKFEKGTPIEVSIEFGMAIPTSATKKKRIEMLQNSTKHIVKPDLDNLVKAVLDALNDIAWHDDAQITKLQVQKLYAEEPHIHIIIKEIS